VPSQCDIAPAAQDANHNQRDRQAYGEQADNDSDVDQANAHPS
jgi:hypothetical protein